MTDKAPAPELEKKTAAQDEAQTGARKRQSETVALEKPIHRGPQVIDSVEVREPTPGQMRGLSLQDIQRADVNSLIVIIPNITAPPLLAHEVESEMCMADLLSIAGAISGFLMTAKDKAALAKVMGIVEQETPTG